MSEEGEGGRKREREEIERRVGKTKCGKKREDVFIIGS